MTSRRPDLAGAAVGIWGFGKEGQSLARTAAAAGAARIDAVDDAGRGTLDAPADIANLNLWRGAAHLTRLADCDVVFLSPGIPWHQPFFAELRDAGTTLSSAADWYLRRYAAQTVGVTGTKGKSTTASFLMPSASSVAASSTMRPSAVRRISATGMPVLGAMSSLSRSPDCRGLTWRRRSFDRAVATVTNIVRPRGSLSSSWWGALEVGVDAAGGASQPGDGGVGGSSVGDAGRASRAPAPDPRRGPGV